MKVQQDVSIRARGKIFRDIDRFLPKRAIYHVRRRRIQSKGMTEILDLKSIVGEDLLMTKGEEDVVEAVWHQWVSRLKADEVVGSRSDTSFTVAWEMGFMIRTYDRPLLLPKSPGPVIADLNTRSYGLRLTAQKESGRSVQLFHQTAFREESPSQLLRPLTQMKIFHPRLIQRGKWARDDRGGLIVYSIEEADTSARYSIYLDAGTGLPRAVGMNSHTASVYSWTKVAKGQMWLASVVQVRRRGREYQVDWLEIDAVRWNPKKPIQIEWPKPSRLLDTRAGRKRWHDFDTRLLPRTLRWIRWPALVAAEGDSGPIKR